MTDREVMQQALDTLEDSHQNINPQRRYADELTRQIGEAITALRERLAQPEQEPVADEEIKLRELNAELLEALTEICDCPQWVDDATVPKAGIDSAPQQVVVNMSVALMKVRKARAIIAKVTGEKT